MKTIKIDLAPKATQIAMEEVRKVFPDVTQVQYDTDVTWFYSVNGEYGPNFNNSGIDVSLLEEGIDAASEIVEFPVIFII